ncbi:MAG: FAD/FMN-containing dehydrogenase/Fe-S oxidoreductase [Mariniblastus sp.]|jgi:FAD/FMN-containing dehydrogenase/Fe-S oxidoreductase
MRPADPLNRSLERLREQFAGEIHLDSFQRTLYSTDASAYQETPVAVAIPKTEQDIQALIQLAREHGVGIIPRTAGTSLAGQVVGAGIVVDVSRHFTKILEINAEEKWVRVQPGVIRNELNLELEAHGLLFGPETSTANRAMIGGMLGNNSCGSNSVVYGSTREHVIEVTGFLSDGSSASFSAVSIEQYEQKCDPDNDSLESRIYREIHDLLADREVRAEIVREFPKPSIARRNTGYAVDLLMDCELFGAAGVTPFDFCKLLAGSEGTLFFATEIKLSCIPLPPPIAGLQCAHFDDVDQALKATLLAVGHAPYAVELIDRFILEGAARNLEQQQNASFVMGSPGAILVTEIRGHSESEVLNITTQLESEMRAANLGHAFPVLFGDDARKVWELRKAGLGIVANVTGDSKPVAVIEDTAVAVEDLPEFIREFNRILDERFGLECVHYAHAGSGEIHLRPILNLKTEAGNQTFRDVAAAVATLVKSFRGSLSGEHGDGRLRGEFLETMIGEKNYAIVQQIKQIWDPQGVFNPNKIVNTPPMNTQLRYQPGQATPEIETVFDFSHEQGVLRAAELCNGSGDCRKTQLSGGTMCPSYMATRNEADSTRARANMLRHVLTEPTNPDNPFDNEELKQVMDLCLSCKGCKRECPSNVDVGKMKAEFLQGYYDTHGVPKRARRIADFSKNMRLASKLPWLFNFLIKFSPTGSILKRISGFSPQRSLPMLHPQTLEKWVARHVPHSNAGSRGQVFLFCDEFTNYNDTPVGIATVELLERIGYRVVIPDHVDSGRPALSKGLLREAKQLANENVRRLASVVSADQPLIGIEPSAILGFRDEYLDLVDDSLKTDARNLASNVLMIDEFLERLIDADELDSSLFVEQEQTIRLHGHCHQKALASLKPTVRMLQLPQGHRVRLIPSGCCGMAGSFGYEAEHYDVSMQIGELVLFPTVRDEPADSLIAAPGTSCRHQIADGTGRRALHPIEILRQALK